VRAAPWLLVLLLLAPHAPAAAQSAIPAHPRDLTFEPLDFDPPSAAQHRHTLPGGGTVFVVEDHALPLVDVSVFVRAGAYLDPPGKTGLAALTGSQMRAGGTASLPAADFDEEVAFLAAQISSSIGDTMGQASLNCLTRDLDAALDLLFDMLRHPRFDQARLDLAKSQALQAMERRNDSTRSIEGREWGRLMRGDAHFSTRPTTSASIESITRDDLLAFHGRYFHPGSFIFAVSGDVAAADILSKLSARLAAWPAADETVPAVPAPAGDPRRGLYGVDKPDVNQGRVSIGHLGTTRDNPDRYPLIVMNDILGGGGFSSRLLTRIRSDEGLAYSAGSSFGMGTYYDGVFRVAFQSRSETVARAAAIVLDEIEKIRSEPVTDDELRNSIASFVETFTRNFSSAAATARLFARDEYTGRDPEYLAHYRERISAVTAADVLRVARRYLHPDRLTTLVVGNLDAIAAGDPDNPDFVLDALAGVPLARIPLPDPFTMEYPAP
jgi:predicted Zn-dependent peptidase